MLTRFALKTPLFIVLLLIISHLLTAQTLLQGQVTDATTGKPLPFATVYINTTTRGTTASENGNYKLTGVPAGTVEVVASYLGYKQAKSVVKLRSGVSTTVNLALAPTGNSLDGVTVTARRSKAWERLFRRFKLELLGDSPFSGRCVFVNEQAVVLTEEENHLRAKVTEPLIIENNALGYRIHYDLLSFDYYERATYYAGATRFEELKPESPQQQKRWQRNRQLAYEGSTRHLIASMVAKTHEQEGYLVYKSNIDLTGRAAAMTPVLIFETDRPPVAQIDSIFGPGELPNERLMVLDSPLEIFSTRINARNSPYRDMPYGYSLLVLPNKTALVTTDGWVSSPNGMEIRGFMSKDRLANLLPADWRPDATAAQPQAFADGTILPPDSRLDSLKRNWKSYQKTRASTVFVHTDKVFYTTGDNLWFSGYLLNPTTLGLLTNRYSDVDEALHVDWVGPSGRTLHHQWVSVKNGRAEGSFQLPDSLQTGTYTLRAYTEAGRAERRPAFEKIILVSNGLSDSPAVAEASPQNTSVVAAQSMLPKTTEPTGLVFNVASDTTGIAVNIRASGPERDLPVYLTVQSRDRFVGQAKIKPTNGVARVMIPAFNIPSGLTRLALFDAQGQPRAEQLVSVSSLPGEPIRLTVTADKPHYTPRETVALQFKLQDDTGDPIVAFLSASITDADQLPADSLSASLQSQVLTNLPDKPLEMTQKPASADTSVGIVLRGLAVNAKGRPVPNANVLLSFIGTTDSFARSAKSDEQGRFQIDGLALIDTAQLTVQVMSADFKPIQATVRFDSPTGPIDPANPWSVDSNTLPDWVRYRAAIQAAHLRQADDAERYRYNGARQLKEVVVKAAKLNDDREARRVSLHGTPDGSVVFKQEDASRYANVFEMLQGKLPGVQVQFNAFSGTYNVVVRGVGSFGGNNGPLFLRDGQYVDQDLLMSTSPTEIERIEVVKNSGGAIYGARGGAGVIAFFTRKWKPDDLNPGGKKLSVVGYPLPRTFTFPAYNADPGAPDRQRIDRRDVLLWQPQFQTDALGQATLKFPLSDVVRTLRVTVQGITLTGQPVSVERLIRVQ